MGRVEGKKSFSSCHRPPGGGTQRVATLLFRCLDRSCFGLNVLLLTYGKDCGALPKGVEVVGLGLSRVNLSALKMLLFVQELKPDICFSSRGYMNIFIMLCRPFMPRGSIQPLQKNRDRTQSRDIAQPPIPTLACTAKEKAKNSSFPTGVMLSWETAMALLSAPG